MIVSIVVRTPSKALTDKVLEMARDVRLDKLIHKTTRFEQTPTWGVEFRVDNEQDYQQVTSLVRISADWKKKP